MMTDPNEVERAISALAEVELTVWRAVEQRTPTFKDFTDAPTIAEDLKDVLPCRLVWDVLTGLERKSLLIMGPGNGTEVRYESFQTIRAALRMPEKRLFVIEGHLFVEKVVKKEIAATDLHEAMEAAEALFAPTSFEAAKEKVFNVAKVASKEDESIGAQKQWSPK